MLKMSASSILALGALFLGTSNAGAAQCVPISGKITNNFTSQDGLGGSTTLGVVWMTYGQGSSAIKLKCGLSGFNQVDQYGNVNNTEVISCDDSAPTGPFPFPGPGVGPVPVNSSIVLKTTGTATPVLNHPTVMLSVNESSTPQPYGARGLFLGVTGGSVAVKGVVYKSPYVAEQPGTLDLKFSGNVCYPQP
jgi:hypothetical protein